jgi:hypothetical protein
MKHRPATRAEIDRAHRAVRLLWTRPTDDLRPDVEPSADLRTGDGQPHQRELLEARVRRLKAAFEREAKLALKGDTDAGRRAESAFKGLQQARDELRHLDEHEAGTPSGAAG